MKSGIIFSVVLCLLTISWSCEDKNNDQLVELRIKNLTDHLIDSIVVSSTSSEDIKLLNIPSGDLSEFSNAVNMDSDLSFKTYLNNNVLYSGWSVPSNFIPDVEDYSKCPGGHYTFSIQDYDSNSQEVKVVLLEYVLSW